jgi:hypothetical protein
MISDQPAAVAYWLGLIQAEYREMPGLHLTKSQVERLWGLDTSTSDVVLAALESQRFLTRTPNNAFVRLQAAR